MVKRTKGLSSFLKETGDEYQFRVIWMAGINENKVVIGGEESAGLSVKGHYPEEDGILARLLAAEAVAARGANLPRS